MSSNDDRLGAELDQLTAAIRDRDGTEATRIVTRIQAIDPAVADRVLSAGIAAGLRRLTGRG